MNTNEDQDRPKIPSNTVLAALAADVGGMLETGISVIANAGHQIGAQFPQLPASGTNDAPQATPRPPVSDLDELSMAMHVRESYMRVLVERMMRELCGGEIGGGEGSPEADELSPDPQGPSGES